MKHHHLVISKYLVASLCFHDGRLCPLVKKYTFLSRWKPIKYSSHYSAKNLVSSSSKLTSIWTPRSTQTSGWIRTGNGKWILVSLSFSRTTLNTFNGINVMGRPHLLLLKMSDSTTLKYTVVASFSFLLSRGRPSRSTPTRYIPFSTEKLKFVIKSWNFETQIMRCLFI